MSTLLDDSDSSNGINLDRPERSSQQPIDQTSNWKSSNITLSDRSMLKDYPSSRLEALNRRFSAQPSNPVSFQESQVHPAPVIATPSIINQTQSIQFEDEEISTTEQPPHEQEEKGKKGKRNFTRQEDDKIIDGVRQFGENWNKLSEFIGDRTPTQLKNRYKRISGKRNDSDTEITSTPTSSAMDIQIPDPSSEIKATSEKTSSTALVGSQSRSTSINSGAHNSGSPGLGNVSNRAKRKNPVGEHEILVQQTKRAKGIEATNPNWTQTKLNFVPDTFGHSSGSNSPSHKSSQGAWSTPSIIDQMDDRSQSNSNGAIDLLPISQQPITHWTNPAKTTDVVINTRGTGTITVASLGQSTMVSEHTMKVSIENAVEEATKTLRSQLEEYKSRSNQLQDVVDSLKKEMITKEALDTSRRELFGQFRTHAVTEMTSVLVEAETKMRTSIRDRLSQETSRLGYIAYGRTGEEYKGGSAARILKDKERKLEDLRESYEAKKKKLAKRKATLNSGSPVLPNEGSGNESPMSQAAIDKELDDVTMQETYLKVKLNMLKSDEADLAHERELIRTDSILHWKELRRVEDEDKSKFNNFPVLNKRYLLLQLLGRGGFSEVYRGYDLLDFRLVACKIHQLASEWSSEKKNNYLRHALRECEIHKRLRHPRVVSLYEIFEIDKDTFCTVLEYCSGGDLDTYLKQNHSISEQEARVLVAQLFDGLKYLATRDQKIIHYDLKPGNILFDENGFVKIADFGLSKILEENSDAMELTSQGAGTYWYLPPECFDREKPQISSKVDVWSAGVILYQMLYGCKPFGNNMSQKFIMERNIINSSLQVDFPAGKKVSEDAKSFLQRCLTPSVSQRPDVVELSSHPFLIFVPSGRRSSTSNASAAANAAKMPPPSTPPLGFSAST